MSLTMEGRYKWSKGSSTFTVQPRLGIGNKIGHIFLYNGELSDEIPSILLQCTRHSSKRTTSQSQSIRKHAAVGICIGDVVRCTAPRRYCCCLWLYLQSSRTDVHLPSPPGLRGVRHEALSPRQQLPRQTGQGRLQLLLHLLQAP